MLAAHTQLSLVASATWHANIALELLPGSSNHKCPAWSCLCMDNVSQTELICMQASDAPTVQKQVELFPMTTQSLSIEQIACDCHTWH